MMSAELSLHFDILGLSIWSWLITNFNSKAKGKINIWTKAFHFLFLNHILLSGPHNITAKLILDFKELILKLGGK